MSSVDHLHHQDLDTALLAYITNANFADVVSRFRVPNVQSAHDLYTSDLTEILSIPELNLLYNYREMLIQLSDSDRNDVAFMKMYKKVVEKVDDKLVFNKCHAAYHLDKECKVLHAEYFNIDIPVEIIERGEGQIELYRAFAKEHKDLARYTPAKFDELVEIHFMTRNKVRTVIHSNSGFCEFNNLQLEAVKDRIDELLDAAACFRYQSKENSEFINRLGYGTHRAKEARIPNHPLYTWHQTYKQPLKQLLQAYFRVRINPGLAFTGSLLEQLNFKTCPRCGLS